MGVTSRPRVGKLMLFVAFALLAFGAIPAGATIYEKGRFTDEFSDTYDDCGFPV